MPRDDLHIDFVRGVMPPADSNLDPASILDEWTNRVINLPEEINFVQNEIADKDRQAIDVLKKIEDYDARIQKWIRVHGSHVPNPQEAAWTKVVTENFALADLLANDKIALTIRLQGIMDKHLRHLDSQIKMLYDRGEPGFTDPDELPSLLRPSAANISAPSARTANPAASNPAIAALHPLANPSATPLILGGQKGNNHTQLRNIQTTTQLPSASSAPVSPAASMILKRGARETSAGPGSGAPARPRLNTNLSNLPNPSSGLARHSSLGPGTPKGHTSSGGGGHQRSGSAGPGARAGGVKGGASNPPLRKGTPSGGRGGNTKKSSNSANPASGGGGGSGGAGGNGSVPKSGLQRVRKTAKNSPSSTAESELSDADSVASSNDSDAPVSQRSGRGTPARSTGGGNGHTHSASNTSNGRQQPPPPHVGPRPGFGGGGGAPRTKHDNQHHHLPPNEQSSYVQDEEEGNDDKKYCICQKVSFGDMVACDNDNCPHEWFHWSCVGLKSEPTGQWYCPECAAEMERERRED